MHKEMWTVVVEGNTYGFFDSYAIAQAWAVDQWPLAYAQNRVQVLEFISV